MAMMPAPGVLEERDGREDGDRDAGSTPGCAAVGATLASGREKGSRLSRDIPKHRRIVAAMIDRQHTKIAADTTSR